VVAALAVGRHRRRVVEHDPHPLPGQRRLFRIGFDLHGEFDFTAAEFAQVEAAGDDEDLLLRLFEIAEYVADADRLAVVRSGFLLSGGHRQRPGRKPGEGSPLPVRLGHERVGAVDAPCRRRRGGKENGSGGAEEEHGR